MACTTWGGMDGFGKVVAEPNEPMFHTEWEARVLAMVRAMAPPAAFNIDTHGSIGKPCRRTSISTVPITRNVFSGPRGPLNDRDSSAAEDVAAGHACNRRNRKARQVRVDDVERIMVRAKFGRTRLRLRKFKPAIGCGKKFTRNPHQAPRYVRGHVGVVERDHGCQYSDSAATESGENRNGSTPSCSRRRLWGPDADPTVKVSIDAFEPYLEPRDGRSQRAPTRPCRAFHAMMTGRDVREPWEAQAFAMALTLHERGLSPGTNGPQPSPTRSGGHRPRAIRYGRNLLSALARDAGKSGRRESVATTATLHRYRDALGPRRRSHAHGTPIECDAAGFFTVIARSVATKQSILAFFCGGYGLLRGACHRARISATRWLAMTDLARRIFPPAFARNAHAGHSPPAIPPLVLRAALAEIARVGVLAIRSTSPAPPSSCASFQVLALSQPHQRRVQFE